MDLPKVLHRPKTPPQPSKSVSPGADASAGLSPTTAFQLNLSQKSPGKNDRASPEPNCSICLGKLADKSFTNGCLHTFCFGCLLQWSKIKAECPLCKQSFKSIIHNVRSMQEYDEYHLPPPNPPRCQLGSNVYQTYQDFLSTIEVHTMAHAAQRLPFRYSTTVTGDTRFQAQIYTTVNGGWVLPRSHSSQRSGSSRLMRQRRNLASNQFRVSVYDQDLWAQAPSDITGRLRDCSPTFYRANPAQVHRLVPWLHRELEALLNSRNVAAVVLDLILKSIARYELDSPELRRLLLPHMGERTDHFLHEFYTFARSHFDLIGYDSNVTYGPNPVPTVAIEVVSDDSSDDSDVLILPQDSAEAPVAGPSGVNRRRNQPSTSVAPPSFEGDSDECQFVQYIKPRHERTPEIIDLSSEDERLAGDETIAIDLGSLSPMDEIQIDELLDYKLEDLDSARMMLENLDSVSSPPSVSNSTSSEYLPPKSKNLAQLRMEREESKKKPPPKKAAAKSSSKGKGRSSKSSKRVIVDDSSDEETKPKKRKTSEEKRTEERGKKLIARKKRVEPVSKPLAWGRLSASSDDDVPLSARSRKRAPTCSRQSHRDVSSSDEDTKRVVRPATTRRTRPSATVVRRTSKSHCDDTSTDEEVTMPLTCRGSKSTSVVETSHASKRFIAPSKDDVRPSTSHSTKPSTSDRSRPCESSRSSKLSSTAVRDSSPTYNYPRYEPNKKYDSFTTSQELPMMAGSRNKINSSARRFMFSSDEEQTPPVSCSRTKRSSTSVRDSRLEYPLRSDSLDEEVLSKGLPKSNVDHSLQSPVYSLPSYVTKPSLNSSHRPWLSHQEPSNNRTVPLHSRSSAHMFASSDEEASIRIRESESLNGLDDELLFTIPNNPFRNPSSTPSSYGEGLPLAPPTFAPLGYNDDEATLPFDSYYNLPAHRPVESVEDSVPTTSRAIPSVIVSPVRTKGKDLPKMWSKMSEHVSSQSDNSDEPTWSIRNNDPDMSDENSSSASTEPEESRPKLKSIVITRKNNQYRASEPTRLGRKRKFSKREWKRETRRVSDSSSTDKSPSLRNSYTDDTDSSS